MNRMKRYLLLFALAAVAVLAFSSTASAQSPHFKRNGEPRCTITQSGSTASTTCTGTLAGLGNEDLLINTSVSGTAVYRCENKGGSQAPGQNVVLVGPAVSPTLIDSDAIKNGNLTFTTNPAVLTAPPTVGGAAAGCPNANWTGVDPTLTVTDINMVIQQPVGTTIFTCTASDPAGLTSPVTLSCV
jgi:hypothetical protein